MGPPTYDRKRCLCHAFPPSRMHFTERPPAYSTTGPIPIAGVLQSDGKKTQQSSWTSRSNDSPATKSLTLHFNTARSPSTARSDAGARGRTLAAIRSRTPLGCTDWPAAWRPPLRPAHGHRPTGKIPTACDLRRAYNLAREPKPPGLRMYSGPALEHSEIGRLRSRTGCGNHGRLDRWPLGPQPPLPPRFRPAVWHCQIDFSRASTCPARTVSTPR